MNLKKSDKEMNSQLKNVYSSKNFSSYYGAKRSEMLDYVPLEATTILDVGCASGEFGQLIKERNVTEVWGVELNEKAAQVASQKLDKVICDSFSYHLDLPKKYFDCVIFNDVLEHLVDPYSALTYAKELLNHRGIIIASIPNVRYFDNIWKLLVHRDWDYGDWGILDKTHLRFFTKKSIIKTFNSLGYEISLIEGINLLEKFHPHQVKRLNILNFIFLNTLEDMRYLQFAVIAKPRNQEPSIA